MADYAARPGAALSSGNGGVDTLTGILKPAHGLRYVALAAALSGLAAAGAWSIRMGASDYQIRKNTVPGTESAIRLMPGDAEYYARLAWLISVDDPSRAGIELRRAVALNPWDAQSWIELGLLAESRGDNTAEQYLLRASQVDSKFLPRWSLANYYFRRNNTAMFWFWAKQAAAMGYGDMQSLFKLCGRVEEDGRLIDRLEIRSPDIRAAYLAYLISQNRIDLIGSSVQRVLLENRAADVPLLLVAAEHLVEAKRVGEAAEVWNHLATVEHVPRPAAQEEQLLTNGAFTETPGSGGHDWRLPTVEGISLSLEEAPRGLRLTFSGREPEECDVLVQLVPLPLKRKYELTFGYRTHGIPTGTGLRWRISDPSVASALAEGSSLASDSDAEGRLVFEAPAGCRLARVALTYTRTPGTTRLEGFLILRNIALKPVGQSPTAGARLR